MPAGMHALALGCALVRRKDTLQILGGNAHAGVMNLKT
jgi:hypothetical protein